MEAPVRRKIWFLKRFIGTSTEGMRSFAEISLLFTVGIEEFICVDRGGLDSASATTLVFFDELKPI